MDSIMKVFYRELSLSYPLLSSKYMCFRDMASPC